MGIKLGSVIEVVDGGTDILEGNYTIDHLDPADLVVPFRGTHSVDGEVVWFRANGSVYQFEEDTTTVVHT